MSKREEEDESSSSDEEGGPTSTTDTKDKYSITPEEQKKQKLRDRKKNKRKRKRQQQGIKRAQEQGEKGEGEEEVKEHPLTVAETVRALKEEADAVAQVEPPKKRVYGVQIDPADVPRGNNLGYDPVMDKFARSTEGEQNAQEMVLSEPKKQHRGMRCSRCFALLCRDDDFEYINGQLHVTGEALKATWDGLIIKGGMVYCQKMHLVGYRKHVTFTNQSKSAVVLKVEKTTFTENYVNNPAFANTEKIRNRLQFQERGNEGMWRQLSLPPEGYRPKELAPADRYHDPVQ
eukprot:Phypoly_transcript_15594.p1 GENE.Phypoly_transcript_15594~~Phypoly_transcript_15594.p1  ORF type:complete len:297 (+),score=65.87 Phypoly_transcript_15594:27-893(+)